MSFAIAPPRRPSAVLSRRRRLIEPQQSYHAAADDGRLYGHRWMSSGIEVDSAMEFDLQTIRNRSRQIYRDDSLGGAVDTRVNHVIATGFTPQSKIREATGISAANAKLWNNETEELFEAWSQKCDVTRKFGLWEASRLAERDNAVSGESFTVLSDVYHPDQPIPLTLEIVDPDRVETPPGKTDDKNCRLGIQYAENGMVLGYWVRKSNPFDTKDHNQDYDFVTADRMIHVLERWFPGQSRGYPWLTRALRRAKDVEDLDEAAIIAAQVEACYVAFVTTRNNTRKLARSQKTGTDSKTSLDFEDMSPGQVRYIPDGDQVTFGTPSRNNVGTMHDWGYRRIAAGINFPYELLTSNWGKLSFAAGRLVLAPARLDCKFRQKLMRERWFCEIWRRMQTEGVFLGLLSIPRADYSMRSMLYRRHRWTPPAWPYAINPKEEEEALWFAVEHNFITLEEAVALHEGDLETTIEQRGKEVAMQIAAGCPQPASSGSAAPVDDKSKNKNADQGAAADSNDDEGGGNDA